jgi:hypothetical protein
MRGRSAARCGALAGLACLLVFPWRPLDAVGPQVPIPTATSPEASAGRIDAEYTRIIRQNLDDPRMTTELVDHLPASDRVPTPLKFFGRVVGTPGELTYATDIARYYQALADTSPRARLFTIGRSEEGRDIVMLAIADEQTIASLDLYRDRLAALTDPRRTTDGEARDLVTAAKPAYWITGGMHSPETGSPETLIELAYRLIVEDTAFVRSIRENVITLITPVLEVDGREKQVDTYYFNKQRAPGDVRLPLMYWGRYVAHDNNRDGIGQRLKLTQAVTETVLRWHPTIVHDLHESQAYLYVSTGTGPYNPELDPIVVHEWWSLAENDVLEMTRRGVPGVWTYRYYDGWMPNYMFFIAHSHNAIGRFYEAQAYGPDRYAVRAEQSETTREWFRPIPPLGLMKWGPRNSVNVLQSALLVTLHHVAEHRETFLDNYWLKNKRSVDAGRSGPTFAWVIPADQPRKADTAEAVNDLRRQGLEVSVAASSFQAGPVTVSRGDYVVRGDQPFRTLAAMYFSIQRFPAGWAPYDDTGWTYQLLRDVTVVPVTDATVLDREMTLLTGDARAPGGVVAGAGSVLVVENTGDSHLAAFRFANPAVKMRSAEEDFEIATANGPRRLRAGSLVIPNADQAGLGSQLADLGLTAWTLPSLPTVPTHDLDLPRIGYVHSWTRTQDEGWWRAAFDAYGVRYTYFADQKLKEGKLRNRYDVIVFPNVGGTPASQLAGLPMSGSAALPYKQTTETPHLGGLDSSDDIRGGMGVEGLEELRSFVRAGGTLLTEGSTAALMPAYGLTSGISAEEPGPEQVHGAVVRGIFADRKSPIAYGYASTDLPVYFNRTPVLSVDAATATSRARVVMRLPASPSEILLSGSLVDETRLAGRALVLDEQVGAGHIVMYALRPFWRWQTQGAYPLVFNALLHWNDLSAGQ